MWRVLPGFFDTCVESQVSAKYSEDQNHLHQSRSRSHKPARPINAGCSRDSNFDRTADADVKFLQLLLRLDVCYTALRKSAAAAPATSDPSSKKLDLSHERPVAFLFAACGLFRDA